MHLPEIRDGSEGPPEENPRDDFSARDLNNLHHRRRKNPLIHKIKSEVKLGGGPNGAHDWSKQVEEEKPAYMRIKDEKVNPQTFYNGGHGDM
jgi:hypothetical protein